MQLKHCLGIYSLTNWCKNQLLKIHQLICRTCFFAQTLTTFTSTSYLNWKKTNARYSTNFTNVSNLLRTDFSKQVYFKELQLIFCCKKLKLATRHRLLRFQKLITINEFLKSLAFPRKSSPTEVVNGMLMIFQFIKIKSTYSFSP